MNSELRVCPNCGAYVMSGDNICPRCDFDLTGPQPAVVQNALDTEGPDSLLAVEIEAVEVMEPEPEAHAEVEAAKSEAVETTEPDDLTEVEADADTGIEVDTTDSIDRQRTTSRLPQVQPVFEIGQHIETGSAPVEAPIDDTRASVVPPAALLEDEAPENEALEDQALENEALEKERDLPPADSSERIDLREGLAAAAAALDAEPSEMPTRQFDAVDPESAPVAAPIVPVAAEITSTQITPQRQTRDVGYIIPPAPYTPPPPPPPTWITPPAEPAYYAAPQGVYEYLQQRVQAYQRGGYRLHVHAPHEAALSIGKGLSVGGWILALVTIIGFFWYLLILAVSGFQADTVYIVLETDGRVYEDGPGAAHVRRARARTGRRWSIFGVLIFLFCLVLAIVLGVAAGIVTTQKRYQAALREAYPAVTLFEERFDPAEADPDDVDLMKNGAVVFAILGGIAAVGLWGGATLFVIGTVHAGAYRVSVPPLPGYA